MPEHKACDNIYNDYIVAKAIIMAGVQQSSIASFVTLLGSWEHFANDAPSAIQQAINNKNTKNNDNKHKKDTKRPRFNSDWLACKDKGLPKSPKLIGEHLCKDYVTMECHCNCRDCIYGGHVPHQALNRKDKDIIDE